MNYHNHCLSTFRRRKASRRPRRNVSVRSIVFQTIIGGACGIIFAVMILAACRPQALSAIAAAGKISQFWP